MKNNVINDKILEEARKLTASFLKNRRKELGLTQAQLAERCGMKQESIARMEASKFYLNTKQLWILCNALDLYFFLEEKESTSPTTISMRDRWGKISPN